MIRSDHVHPITHFLSVLEGKSFAGAALVGLKDQSSPTSPTFRTFPGLPNLPYFWILDLIVSKNFSSWNYSFPVCIALVGVKDQSSLWQYGLWSFQTGGTKLERFLPKNQHTQRKLLNFENWVNGEVSKIGNNFRKQSDLKIDVIKKCQQQKMCSWIRILQWKKIRKIRMIFDIENWPWESNFCIFWQLFTTPILQICWFHLTKVEF